MPDISIATKILSDRSKENVLHIADWACRSESNAKQLVDCVMDENRRLSELASWCFSWAARQRPERFQPYLHLVLGQLSNEAAHNAVRRNILRVLEEIDIPEPLHGEVMNACFGFVEEAATEVAIQAGALTVLHKLSHSYPEIRPELVTIIHAKLPYATASIKARANRILKQINRRPG